MTDAEQKLNDQAYELLRLMRKLEIVPDRKLAKMIKTMPLGKYDDRSPKLASPDD